MHRYDIYLLKTEYANSFVRAEDKLFRLFKEYETVKPLYEIVKKQIEYICRPLSMDEITEQLPFHKKKMAGGKVIFIEDEQKMKMSINEQRIQLWSEEGHDDEWPWFDTLQSLDPYFFACDVQREKYGWLKPVKFKSLLI
ncbi:sporulation inhibitor of replication protein SirA [Geomicrobium sp. JCM 19038]|uniref:sporulation inhibitor of replication protein SirA n=1 Tax=Geomicrobium sp. JCM 19038 TaxID=1460635 RepID=UPI00045F1071|nr:sporulation inhibitor of replication protein SirA [Geomicrobium sp. JCM 19038]GAK09051.1 YoxF protein [Geomicrobium sp. JCM 19038]